MARLIKKMCFIAVCLALCNLQETKAQMLQNKPTFDHIAIIVKDLVASTKFYEDVIGLDQIKEPFHDGKHAWFKIGTNLQLHVILKDGAPKPPLDVHLCFRLNSVEAFIKHLDKYKLNYYNSKGEVSQVNHRIDGVEQIYLQDPDGYWIEINDAKY
jgi:lactoylglutathione lyase